MNTRCRKRPMLAGTSTQLHSFSFLNSLVSPLCILSSIIVR